MNTKTFAQQARSLLMEGVAKKLIYWGFNPKGEVLEEPTAVSGGYTFRGDAYDDANVPRLWTSLKNAIAKKGIEVVVEEAAYTWFNRMMAIRILAKNGYNLPQLDYAEGLKNTPVILQKARQGQYAFLNDTEKTRLQKIIGDYNKETEAFALLLVGYCHSHNTLNKVFGKLDDYTELLLPDNMLQDQGFLHLLNTTDAISDEEYQQVELIGWLYQFYISERKDEVFKAFKKKKKAEAKDIPAATQIFTPNWIVKYMVENTAGKLWRDHKPNSPLKDQMKYLVTNEDAVSSSAQRIENKALITDVEMLTLIDPACGSGHILVEGFALLYQMYLEEYYTPEEAVQTIFEKNLYGLDIDERAAQLATFAVMLKAANVYSDVWDKNWQLNIYAMPEANSFSQQEVADFLGEEGKDHIEALEKALQLMQQAKNLGSVMQLNLSEEAVAFIAQRYQAIKQEDFLDFNLTALLPKLDAYIPVLLTLSRKFTAVVANPPYMGSGKMNSSLKHYININYNKTKSDLYAVFIEVCLNKAQESGIVSLINQKAWAFLSVYEKYRSFFLKNYQLRTFIQLGANTFKELSGEQVKSVVFTIENTPPSMRNIIFYKLSKLKDVESKKEAFLKGSNRFIKDNQLIFDLIPGKTFAFWVSDKMLVNFENDYLLKDFSTYTGLIPGKTDRYLKYYWEPKFNSINFSYNGNKNKESHYWVPISHGGRKTKWYGSYNEVVNYKNNANEMRSEDGSMFRNENKYFKKGLNWNRFNPSKFAARIALDGLVFEDSSPTLITERDNLLYLLGLFNTNLFNSYIKIFQGAQKVEKGHIESCPIIYRPSKEIDNIVFVNINISKKDWDSRETSWDFERSPLLLSDQGLGMRDENSPLSTRPSSLSEAYERWEKDVTQDFFQLHQNEEELNRIFIDIYGLQDELTPEVALKDITILQEELDRKQLAQDEVVLRQEGLGLSRKDKGLSLVPENYTLPIDKAEVMQQFISYAIGLFMGRYRLDKPGLNIAHPNPTAEELASYDYNNGHVTIDEDAIVPLMGTAANFKDDALYQIPELLDTIWSAATRTENLNFLQDGLNKDLEKYLVKDFWKYHCKTYKKKPIYWLFSSKKGAFQVLVYMHRMNAFTVEKIRANYLLEHLKYLNAEITALENNAANLNTQQARKLDQLRKDLVECEEYDMHLKNAADAQITFDLDDGVTENYKLFTDVVAKIK